MRLPLMVSWRIWLRSATLSCEVRDDFRTLRPILDAWKGPIILYHPVGANHQAPPEYFRTAPRVQYIHSIENWEALERGLRAVHTKVRLAQSRMLRVSGQLKSEADAAMLKRKPPDTLKG